MTLPKHLRPRWRYLAVALETWPDVSVRRDHLQRASRVAARRLYGDVGAASTEMDVVHFEQWPGGAEAIVRTHRDTVEEARAALACVTTIEGASVRPCVQGVSGTIRACEENYLGSGAEPSSENTVVFEGAERPAVLRGEEVDVRVDDAYVGATRLDLE